MDGTSAVCHHPDLSQHHLGLGAPPSGREGAPRQDDPEHQGRIEWGWNLPSLNVGAHSSY